MRYNFKLNLFANVAYSEESTDANILEQLTQSLKGDDEDEGEDGGARSGKHLK